MKLTVFYCILQATKLTVFCIGCGIGQLGQKGVRYSHKVGVEVAVGIHCVIAGRLEHGVNHLYTNTMMLSMSAIRGMH